MGALGQRLWDWNLSSPELHASLPAPGFSGWDSMATDEDPTPTSEYFSAETWSEHLQNQAKAQVFELGDTSVQESDVESN